MNTYYIYKLNDIAVRLLEQYSNIKKRFLTLEAKNQFFTNQIATLFQSNDEINDYIFDKLKDRSDYKREFNVHTIFNQLTKEYVICKVNDYNIEITANQKENIFFDILYQKSKKYVIIDEQLKK